MNIFCCDTTLLIISDIFFVNSPLTFFYLEQVFNAFLESKIPIGVLVFKLGCMTNHIDNLYMPNEARIKKDEKILSILRDEKQIKLLHPLKVSHN